MRQRSSSLHWSP
ncbi:hypothetical protein LINPERHAP1_LOCUS9191 [Linum perenne]